MSTCLNPMIICPNCGWEIPRDSWTVAGDLCDDCHYDKTNEVSRFKRIIKKVIRQ